MSYSGICCNIVVRVSCYHVWSASAFVILLVVFIVTDIHFIVLSEAIILSKGDIERIA